MTDQSEPGTRIPLVDLASQYAEIAEEVEAAVLRVLRSQRLILGPEVEAFERELARFCGRAHAVGCGSGSDAVLLSLMAHDVGPGDEVICPSYTFFATASAVARLGARPVFADIDARTYGLCPEDARRAARGCRRLRAVVPVHLFGQCADTEALEEFAAELGVPLIEDAAQAIGSLDEQGRPAGSRGVLGCFSLYPTKNLSAAGDGGVLICDDAEIAARLRSLRSHAARTAYQHDDIGINSRLDSLQAAILRVKLPRLERWNELRAEHAARYDTAFLEAGAGRSGDPAFGPKLPLQIPWRRPSPARHVYHQYVVNVPPEHRDPLRAHLEEVGVATAVYYPKGLHQQHCFATISPTRALPATEAAAQQTLALPVYPELGVERQQRVIDALLSYFRTR